MRRAFNLLVLREGLLARHWSRREWFSGLLTAAIMVVTYIVAHRVLTGMAPEARMLAVVGLIEVAFLLGFIFTAANFVKSWFSAPDAFYLTTCPTPVKGMYTFHYLDAGLGFCKHFGHLLAPAALSFGMVVGGWPGAILLLGAFFFFTGLAVTCGFLYMFFVLRGTNLPLRAGGGLLAGVSVLGVIVGLGLVWPIVAVGVSVILIFILFRQTPRYAEKAFRECQEVGSGRWTINIATPWQRCLEKIILGNRFLKPRFRAFLYREMATDTRNIIFLGKYLLAVAMFFLYWPLQGVEFVARSGMAGAIIFCFLVFATSIFESLITTFAKEGDRIVFLLPALHSWPGVGLAKFWAAVVEMLPLLPVAVLVVGSRWHWSGWETLTFAVCLALVTALYLAITVVAATGLLSLENHDFTLWEGMIYEQILGYLDPRIMRRFFHLQIIPALLVFAIWMLHIYFPAEDFITVLWYLNMVMAALVIGVLLAGQRVLTFRLAALLK